jgi:hypothetical protein
VAKRKQKRPGGRKPLLRTEKQRARFIKILIECGGVLNAACRRAGVTKPTVYNERDRDPEFAAMVEEAATTAHENVKANVWKHAQIDPELGLRLLRLIDTNFQPRSQVEVRGTVEHEHEVRITVVEDDHWYGNEAHARANGSSATRVASSGSNLVIPGTVQGGDVRSEVGKNGHGSNGHG